MTMMTGSTLGSSSQSNVAQPDLILRLKVLEHDVNELQRTAKDTAKPWYRNFSSLLAAIALVFSLGTTAVSYYRAYTQDIQVSRQQLSDLLQKLSAIPRENFDASIKYKDNPAAVQQLSGYYNQENALLGKQAAEVAKHLPPKIISSTECYAIAMALENSMDLAGAENFLQLARDHVSDFNDEIAITRSMAALDFINRKPDDGRKEFDAAMNIFAKPKYSSYNPLVQTENNVMTQLQWARVEMGYGFSSEAKQHIDAAEQLVNTLLDGPDKQNFVMQITQLRKPPAEDALPIDPTLDQSTPISSVVQAKP